MGNCWGASSGNSPVHITPSSPGPYNTSKTSSNSTSTTNTSKLSSLSTSTFNPSTGSGSGSGSDDPLCPEGRILENPNLRIFTFTELRSATKSFKPDTVLGEGGFGRVFKGWVDEKTLNPTRSGSGLVIAVKKLNPESLQGLEEWQSEVHFLGRLSHPNLVKLLGYCWEDKDLLLVYEFMPRGSLENHLFRRGTYEPLSWDLRIKIATGAARGLVFLHTSDRQVIYRDFKASNILLDSNYNAKLSDFGLAKLGPTGSNSHVTTRVMGTSGYAAPEYVATGHLYVKSDVYGFGVVLLEMLSGQRALDPNRPSNQLSLVDWAKPLLSDRRRLARLMDPRLEGKYPSKAALEAANLSLNCLASEPKNRPSMKEVVEKLEKIEAMKGARSRDIKQAATRDRGRGKVSPNGRSPHNPRHYNAGSGVRAGCTNHR